MAPAGKSDSDEANEPKVEESSKGIDGSGGIATPERSSSHPNLKRGITTPTLSTTSSAATSPKPSREGSPTRPTLKSGASTAARLTSRSRNNSTDLSPNRASSISGPSIPTVPSAAAIQRALAASGTPHLPSPANPDPSSIAQRPQKVGSTALNGVTPGAKSIPRLSSPPPALSSGSNETLLNTARKIDQTQSTPSTPTIVVDRPARSSTFASENINAAEEDRLPRSGMRTPVRGVSGNGLPLETVQEGSQPSSPAKNTGQRTSQGVKSLVNDRPEPIQENSHEDDITSDAKSRPESGNESAGNKKITPKSGDDGKVVRKPATEAVPSKSQPIQSRKSVTNLPIKAKVLSEGSAKNMTVETETVSSIPQVALGGGAGERNLPGRTDTGASLKTKPSTETIRPKKDKKKVVRKAPTASSGTGGLISKRFHHHHVHTRPSSPDLNMSSSFTSTETFHGEAFTYDEAVSPLRNSDCKTKQVYPTKTDFPLSSPNPQGPPRRFSTGLINFRGRTASSKADIFEAKIASAVDEANSSDSEETFVYESNPPEPHSARPHRFHSRTPSMASVVSQIDQYGAKGRQDGHHSIVGKKSMKFANNYNSIGYQDEGEGTVRGSSQHGRGNGSSHHHHIGRYGRSGHTSLFDHESPFPNATKPPKSAPSHVTHFPNRHASPRNGHVLRVSGSPRKAEEIMAYDLEGEAADDERAPLMGSIRMGRTRRRPLPGSVRQMYSTEDTGCRACGKATAFISLGSILALLIAAIVMILVMCTKPLLEVHVKDIRNVLASEQELMLDLHVHAVNPNLIAIQVSDLDINIFAKSKHVGTSSLWRSDGTHVPNSRKLFDANKEGRPPTRSHPWDPSDIISHLGSVDEGTDPIDDDPATDAQKMLLGQIFEFDTPLIFDPSPLRHHSVSSLGEVRLAKPGNHTEEGGSQRWEHVLQHDFELIVRGVMHYSSPVSSKTRSVSVAGSIIVHPSDPSKSAGMMTALSGDRDDAGRNVGLRPRGEGKGVRLRFFA